MTIKQDASDLILRTKQGAGEEEAAIAWAFNKKWSASGIEDPLQRELAWESFQARTSVKSILQHVHDYRESWAAKVAEDKEAERLENGAGI